MCSKPATLVYNMIVAIDIGGTKTLVAGFDRGGEPMQEHRFPTPKDTDQFLSELIELLDKHYDKSEIDAISIAVPGFVNDGVVVWCGNLPWKNFDLKTPLKELFGAPIFVENDANLAGLSEANALKPVPRLCLYLTFSTGIGSGFIADGKITPSFAASEAGHMVFEFDGKLREWESFASGKAIHETYGKYAYEIDGKKTWDEIAQKMSVGLSAIVPLLQPDVIVMGGGVGTHFARYHSQLESLVDKRLPDYIERPRIIQAKHPQEAVIYGCYYQAVHRLTGKS
jgi:predicted NBD/HSP70 family sugar kinase